MDEKLVENAIILDSEEKVGKVAQILEKGSAAIVTKQGCYFGIVEDTELAEREFDPETTKLEVVARKVSAFDRSEPNINKLISIFSGRVNHAPVVENGKPVGIIRIERAIENFITEERMEGICARDIMNSPVVAISEDASIAQARAVMKREKVRRLAVLRKKQEESEVVGILQLSDIAGSQTKDKLPYMKEKEKPAEGLIKTLVKEVGIIGEESPASEVKSTLLREGSLIVVNKKNNAVGIITPYDFIELGLAPELGQIVRIEKIDEETRHYVPEIKGTVEKFTGKFKDMISSISLKFKKEKGIYHVRATLALKKKNELLFEDISDYKLHYALKSVLDKLKKRMIEGEKFKQEKARKRRGRKI